MNAELISILYYAFVVGVIIHLFAATYITIVTENRMKATKKSLTVEREECARLTKENQALREANQQIGKESFEEGILRGKSEYFLNEVKA